MLPETEATFDSLHLSFGGQQVLKESFKLYSCTVVIGKTVLFFGGFYQPNQISQLTPLGLVRTGTLPFALLEGICLATEYRLILGFGVAILGFEYTIGLNTYKNTYWSR